MWCNKGVAEKLSGLQNRKARLLMSVSYDSNLNDAFRALGWCKLCYQRLGKKAILGYKTMQDMAPDCL